MRKIPENYLESWTVQFRWIAYCIYAFLCIRCVRKIQSESWKDSYAKYFLLMIIYYLNEEKENIIFLFVISFLRLLIRTSHFSHCGNKIRDKTFITLWYWHGHDMFCSTLLSFSFFPSLHSFLLFVRCAVRSAVYFGWIRRHWSLDPVFIFKCVHISMICINRKCGIRIISFCLTLI